MQPMTVCLPQRNRYGCHTQTVCLFHMQPMTVCFPKWTATNATHGCRPVFHSAHAILFATTEQLQMPHTAVCQSLMQPNRVCVLQLNSYRCHTRLYASLSCSPWHSVCYSWTATISKPLYASLSCSPWLSVYHKWTATDVSHSCMPVSHAAHNSLFTTTEQVQMPHTAVCQTLVQPMTVFLPQLNNYICQTQWYISPSFSPWKFVYHNWTPTNAILSWIPVCHATHDSLFATTGQLYVPQTRLYASLSWSPWQSVCHNWTATCATHSPWLCFPQMNRYRCHT